jgi:hypothetical protein
MRPETKVRHVIKRTKVAGYESALITHQVDRWRIVTSRGL